MDDSISILLATTILALGGLGLYMYKSPDDTSSSKDTSSNNTSSKEDDDEDNLFGSNLFNWGLSDENENENENVNDDKVEEPDEDIKPRKRAAKTHKNRKMTGSSRRRY
jgi:hypothetical protein